MGRVGRTLLLGPRTVNKIPSEGVGAVALEQVRKGGLPPLFRERGQAALPDLLYCLFARPLSFRLKIAVILEQLIVFFATVCTTYGLDVVRSPDVI